jgi:hypothetical protein
MNDNDVSTQSKALLLSDLDDFIEEKKNEFETKYSHLITQKPKTRTLKKQTNH